jgi:hypothetical protein
VTYRQPVVGHLEWSSVRKTLVVGVVAALFAALFAIAAVAQEKATGLERAAEATMQGLEKSQGNSAEAPGQANRASGLDKQGEKLTGRERAAAAIAAAIGNGNGNAYGRGNSTWVHEMLAAGEIPGQIKEQNHGHAVRDMVHAFNELRKNAS